MWVAGKVTVALKGRTEVRPAAIYHDLAVVRVHPAGGFCIVHKKLGLAIEVGGRVCVEEAVAKRIVVRLWPLMADWYAYFSPHYSLPEDVRAKIEAAFMAEEPMGFLPMRVTNALSSLS